MSNDDWTPPGSKYTFIRRADGMIVVVTAGTRNVIDRFRDERPLTVVASEWLGELA